MCVPGPSRPSLIPEPCYSHIQDKSRRDLKLFCILPLGLRGLQTLAELGRALCGENTSWRTSLAEEQTEPGFLLTWVKGGAEQGLLRGGYYVTRRQVPTLLGTGRSWVLPLMTGLLQKGSCWDVRLLKIRKSHCLDLSFPVPSTTS